MMARKNDGKKLWREKMMEKMMARKYAGAPIPWVWCPWPPCGQKPCCGWCGNNRGPCCPPGDHGAPSGRPQSSCHSK